MDIALPDLNQQVSPQPWLLRHSQLHLEELIRADLEQHPQATPDEVVGRLAQQDIEVSGTYVAAFMAKTQAGKPAAD